MFSVNFYYGETSFNWQNYFSRAEISYERKRVLFDQIQMIKKNKKVTLKTGETYVPYRKPQELKIAKIVFRKFLP